MMLNSITLFGVICLFTAQTTWLVNATPVSDGNQLYVHKVPVILEQYRHGLQVEDDVLTAVMNKYQGLNELSEAGKTSPEEEQYSTEDETEEITPTPEIEDEWDDDLEVLPKDEYQGLLGASKNPSTHVKTNEAKVPIQSDEPPNLCQDPSIDTITRTEDGNTYVFKGNYYWKIVNKGIAEGYPRRIADDWGGLEGHLDASFTKPYDGTYFFKGKYYWKFTNQHMGRGFPKLISDGFEGIPDNVDAALCWSANHLAYFFKDDEYWRFNKYSYPQVDTEYPRELHHWRGVPVNNIDAAFVWDDGYTYFFAGENFYRYDDPVDAVAVNHPPYPHRIAQSWFSCNVTC